MKKLLKKILTSKAARNAAALSILAAATVASAAGPWSDSPSI